MIQGKIIQDQHIIRYGMPEYKQRTILYHLIGNRWWYRLLRLPNEPYVLHGLEIRSSNGRAYYRDVDVIEVLAQSVTYRCRAFVIHESKSTFIGETENSHRLICYFSHSQDLLRFRLKIG